jgi:regulator of replication initiation timing
MILAMESLTALWVVVCVGGLVSIGMTGALMIQTKGLVSRKEVHEELSSLEAKMAQDFAEVSEEFKQVDERFESERTIAREANEKIYNRLNDCAKGVTRVEAKFEGFEKMLAKLVDKQMQ